MSRNMETKPITVRFHRNGVFVIEDSQGILHVLDPQETLRDVAKYIWREETLTELRIEGEESAFKDYKEAKFVKLSDGKDEKKDRLRFSSWEDDTYYQE